MATSPLQQLVNNRALVAAAVGWFAAQTLKVVNVRADAAPRPGPLDGGRRYAQLSPRYRYGPRDGHWP